MQIKNCLKISSVRITGDGKLLVWALKMYTTVERRVVLMLFQHKTKLIHTYIYIYTIKS